MERVIHALEETILLTGLAGEIPLTAIDDYAARSERDPVNRKRMVLDAARALLLRRYIVLGNFAKVTDDTSEWREWRGTVDALVDRLTEAYTPAVEDWESWGFLCWSILTPEGEKFADTINPSRSDPQISQGGNVSQVGGNAE